MPLKISHDNFCSGFIKHCDDITCKQCKDIFNAIKDAEEKFNSALRQPTGKLYNGPCAKNVIIYCQEFDPANKTCQSCDVRPTA